MDVKIYESEWTLLQNQYDSYEKHSLYIKLVSILALVFSEITDTNSALIFGILLGAMVTRLNLEDISI